MAQENNLPDTSAEAQAAKEAFERMQGVKEAPPSAPPGEGVPVPTLESVPPKADDPVPDPAPSVVEPTEELPDGERRFVAPGHRGGKFLAHAGDIVQVPSPRGPWNKERIGDIWVNFANGNGVFSTKDPKAIAWCEAHPEICRDAFDPKTPAWVAITEATLETPTQGARLPRSTDIEAMLRGDASGLGGSGLVKRARGE